MARKAEALYLADRTSEALAAIKEAEALADRLEYRDCFSAPKRLRSVFLAALGAEQSHIEASFLEAIRIARERKSVSLQKRAEATYAEYYRQEARAPGAHGVSVKQHRKRRLDTDGGCVVTQSRCFHNPPLPVVPK